MKAAVFVLFVSLLLLQVNNVNSQRIITDGNHGKRVRSAAKSDAVAFTAELSKRTEIGPGGTIIFDRVLSNVGGLYFNTSGQFACPDGLYVFIWNLMKHQAVELPGMRCIGALRNGGIDIKYGPKTNYFDSRWSGVSQMTAIHDCSSNPPTAVTVTSQPWTEEVGGMTLFFPGYTTFSGFKLQTTIAFTAELSQEQLALPGGRVMFDKVLANFGGRFDVTNAIFRCPDAGVYVFSVSTHNRDNSTQWSVSRLMMEREVIIQGPITYIATDEHDSGSASTTAVLQCSPDFSVYIEAQASHDFPYNAYAPTLTSFTGYKLYDVTTEAIAFTVVMSHNFTAVTDLQPVQFDEVITNVGSAFETLTSRFVCPDDDHYAFTWGTVAPDTYHHMDLSMDGSTVKELRTTQQTISDETGTSGSCAMTTILLCQPGSIVQVVSRSSGYTFLGGFTSFSGFRLPG